ncbi:uncharacterized protein LOC119920816 [Tachyglossus aculeatus]|uniref:uncharacterized protein LOC119920816 n=1 Tax=Tachyglossus aculeatus TaxID=9261 RepID=UPI0018F4FF3A|nr:uncharacterized protein LOC119920816 [Tachyglossus aculeatus]
MPPCAVGLYLCCYQHLSIEPSSPSSWSASADVRDCSSSSAEDACWMGRSRKEAVKSLKYSNLGFSTDDTNIFISTFSSNPPHPPVGWFLLMSETAALPVVRMLAGWGAPGRRQVKSLKYINLGFSTDYTYVFIRYLCCYQHLFIEPSSPSSWSASADVRDCCSASAEEACWMGRSRKEAVKSLKYSNLSFSTDDTNIFISTFSSNPPHPPVGWFLLMSETAALPVVRMLAGWGAPGRRQVKSLKYINLGFSTDYTYVFIRYLCCYQHLFIEPSSPSSWSASADVRDCSSARGEDACWMGRSRTEAVKSLKYSNLGFSTDDTNIFIRYSGNPFPDFRPSRGWTRMFSLCFN